MNFCKDISVKSSTFNPKISGVAENHLQLPQPPYHLQPPQTLYQNEEDNPRINLYNYIEVRLKVYWPESGLKALVP